VIPLTRSTSKSAFASFSTPRRTASVSALPRRPSTIDLVDRDNDIANRCRSARSESECSLIDYHFLEQPAPVLLVLPAEADARNAVVALEEIFECSPALRGRLVSSKLPKLSLIENATCLPPEAD
jgi:hypothetical protein